MIDDALGFEILKEVTLISGSMQDLDETLKRIIEVIKNKMRIDACAIFLVDEDGVHLSFKASSGVRGENPDHLKLRIGDGITGWVAQHRTALALSDALNDPRAVRFPEVVEEKFISMLSVPMIFNNQCIGVVNVGTRKERVFTEREISLLETISTHVSGCIRNALVYQKRQKLIRELTILYDISMAVQTTLNMEQGLWIILSGITMGEAGGFNRAILFTVNEKTNELEGMLGLGPDSPEDAHRIWTELSNMESQLLEWVVSETDKDVYKRSVFNTFARSLKFPIRKGESVLAETVIQRKPFNVVNAENDPRVSREFLACLGVNAFATVPLVAHEKVLGVILVDNRYNDKRITNSDLRLLTRFAIHASWVMENARLFSQLRETNRELLSMKEQLSQSEKLAALGELSAEVAHEIKNPLVSVGGFARRLKDRVSKFAVDEKHSENHKAILKYADIILNEVERLETLLKDILFYSKSSELVLEDCSINQLLKEVTQLFESPFYEKKILFQCHFDDNIETLRTDRQKIKQVLINLFYNAVESMPHGGKLTVQTYLGETVKNREMVTIRMEDTGGGIPHEVFLNIFHPFFTTKDSGTGLGLPICKRIVESLGGDIRLDNMVGQGVTVYLQLPLQAVFDLNKN